MAQPLGTYAPPPMGNAPQKTPKLVRKVAKWQKREARELVIEKQTRKEQAAWLKRSGEVRLRDKGVCRCCSAQTTRWDSPGDPRLWGAAHHLRPKSLCGPDEMWNLIWICYGCHSAIHDTRTLVVTGPSEALVVQDGSRT